MIVGLIGGTIPGFDMFPNFPHYSDFFADDYEMPKHRYHYKNHRKEWTMAMVKHRYPMVR